MPIDCITEMRESILSLDGFSMYPLVRELKAALCGGRIDKITQPNKQLILLSVRQPGESFWLHISINPQNPVAYIAKNTLENPAAPPVFCMVLRKQIETGRIADIRQHGLDRLLVIDIDFLSAGGKIVTKSLIIELMGKYSNIILVQDKLIIDALRKVGTTSSRVRTVLPGQEYLLPPGQDKLNLLETSPDTFIQAIQQLPEQKLSKALLDTCLGFGPVSARETAFLAGLSPSLLVRDLEESDLLSLKNALQEILSQCTSAEAQACLVLDEPRKLLATAAFPLHYFMDKEIRSFPSVSEMLSASTRFAGTYVLPDKERFKKLVRNEINRADNKIGVLKKELADAQNADDYRQKADNLMTWQNTLQDHADTSVTLTNIYSPAAEAITIELDQRFSIMQNIQSYYHKYDKLKRAQELLKVQVENCLRESRYLASIEASLDASSSLAEINEIRNELILSGYLKESLKKKQQDKPSLPFRFAAGDGTEILVGKNNYQNDKLTFKQSQPNDIWLHTKDIPGSHVILRCAEEEPAEENIYLASCLAAHFSKAVGSSKIPVDYTRCRYVKKPSGSKPGFVIFTNQKTLFVTPDEAELKTILAKDLNAR